MVVAGLFDSGVGGLTVARQIFQKLPQLKIIYYGDTARVPYGGKSVAELIYLADIITGFLIEQGAQVIIDACNSTSAVALEHLQAKYQVPVLGVIEPGVKAALAATQNGKIGLIATEATIKSGMYVRKIKEAESGVEVFSQACPGFVPLIEQGEVDSPRLKDLAREYLKPLKEQGIDTLILGCTHYPFISKVLAEILGPQVILVDPAIETVNVLTELVNSLGNLSQACATPEHHFYTSGEAEHFRKIASMLLPRYPLKKVDKLVVK